VADDGRHDANPAAYAPDLAMSLTNQAVQLAELARRDEAVAPIQEAVQIRRQLADANPAAYAPDLATSLNNQAIQLAELGRQDEALPPIEKAVQIFRRLAADNPAAYAEGLNRALMVQQELNDQSKA
jgi:tetratricopeptide (TPR) repeat protein